MDLLRKVNPGFYGFLATAWTECSAFPKAGSARDEPIFRSLNELIQRSTSSRFRGNLQLWQEFWLGGPWQFALQQAEKTWPFRTSHVHKKGAVFKPLSYSLSVQHAATVYGNPNTRQELNFVLSAVRWCHQLNLVFGTPLAQYWEQDFLLHIPRFNHTCHQSSLSGGRLLLLVAFITDRRYLKANPAKCRLLYFLFSIARRITGETRRWRWMKTQWRTICLVLCRCRRIRIADDPLWCCEYSQS